DDEQIADRNESAAVDAAHDVAEGEHDHERHDERSEPEHVEIVHAARHAHRLADGPKEAVPAEHEEVEQRRGHGERQLAAFEVQQPAKQVPHGMLPQTPERLSITAGPRRPRLERASAGRVYGPAGTAARGPKLCQSLSMSVG